MINSSSIREQISAACAQKILLSIPTQVPISQTLVVVRRRGSGSDKSESENIGRSFGQSIEEAAMVFQLGKTKSGDEETVRQETFKRWREASQRSQTVDAGSSTPVEEIQVENIPSVQWPDPRATISLTNEVARPPIQEEIPTMREPAPIPPTSMPIHSMAPMPAAATTAPQQAPMQAPAPQRPTSKLAQFVSSGLNATGLLGSHRSAAPQSAAPQNTKVVESVRLVGGTKPEPKSKITPLSVAPAPAPEPEDDIKRRFGTNIRSALGPGTIIEGTFSFDTPVCIEGTLIGEVRSNSVLIVGDQATVNAKVKVGSLIVLGTVKGDVEATELVEIKGTGSLEGDVISERFAIEDGGWFQGRCTPTSLRSTIVKAPAVTVESETVLVGEEPIMRKLASSDNWTMD